MLRMTNRCSAYQQTLSPSLGARQLHIQSPPPCGEVEMLKRLLPRGISGGGTMAAARPPPEIAREKCEQFRPPHKGEAICTGGDGYVARVGPHALPRNVSRPAGHIPGREGA